MPAKVCYEDFPLFQFSSSKQFVINKLATESKAVALPHPNIRNGYSDEDLKKLTGYNLMEVLNHAALSEDKWDIALSAGKPVWIIGDDDTHNCSDTTQTFTNWTMINCQGNNKDSIIENLANGNAYAVNGKNALNDNKLLNVTVEGWNVSIQLESSADSIKLIGQNGSVRKTCFNTSHALYTFSAGDTYLRAVVYNRASRMYLNPVIRYNGSMKPKNIFTAKINHLETAVYRLSWLLGWVLLTCYIYGKNIKRLADQVLGRIRVYQTKYLTTN
jgi:hypothetical protein